MLWFHGVVGIHCLTLQDERDVTKARFSIVALCTAPHFVVRADVDGDVDTTTTVNLSVSLKVKQVLNNS